MRPRRIAKVPLGVLGDDWLPPALILNIELYINGSPKLERCGFLGKEESTKLSIHSRNTVAENQHASG